jgi:RTX calcium-binding nonapeptide repeat (4 copies)
MEAEMAGLLRSWGRKLAIALGAAALLVPFLSTAAQAVPCTRQLVGGRWTYYGTDGNNYCTGTSGPDVFWTYGGADTVEGRDGNDEIHTGSGPDTAYGGSGADEIRMGEGNDDGFGGSGNDSLFMGDWQNQISGVEEAHGEDGNDFIKVAVGLNGWGGNGNDYLDLTDSGYTPEEPSFFYGGPGTDDANLRESDYLDSFFGGYGNDGRNNGAGCLTDWNYDVIRGDHDPIDFEQDEAGTAVNCNTL